MTERRPGRVRRLIHWLFEASLIVKGTLTAAEALAGVVLLTSSTELVHLVDWLVAHQLAIDPDDPVAGYLAGFAAQLALPSEHFYALYLIGHGGLKLLMVAGLALRIVWAYPLSMALLAGFAVYEIWGFLSSGSVTLLALAALDLFMIWLVWREYLVLRAVTAGGNVAPRAGLAAAARTPR